METHRLGDEQYDEMAPYLQDGQSLTWNDDSNAHPVNDPQTYLQDNGNTVPNMPTVSNTGPAFGLEFDHGYDQHPDAGQYQPDYRVSNFDDNYLEPTQQMQTRLVNQAPANLPPPLATYSDPNTLSDADLFWVQYAHGSNIGRDLFPLWKGLQKDDLPPRETLRLIPNEDRNVQHLNGKLRNLVDENGQVIRSDLTDEPLKYLPFLPRYIDMKQDATTKNIDNWIIMGADLRRDIIPRSYNFNPYHSFDKDRKEFFDSRGTVSHLQRTYTNKHMKRAEQPHVLGGLLRKFRMDKGRFTEFLTPVTFDSQGNQRRLLLTMENLLFNTRWDIDMERMVMKNPNSLQELPLFTPVEVRPAVRECLEKQHSLDKIPTLRDLWERYPHVMGYDETKHPLYRRAEAQDLKLRQDWEREVLSRGNRKPAPVVIKPNYHKERKETAIKRRQADIQNKRSNLVDPEEQDDDNERPRKRIRKDNKPSEHKGRPRWRASAMSRTKRQSKSHRNPPPPPLNLDSHDMLKPSQPSTYLQTPHTTTFVYSQTPHTATFPYAPPPQAANFHDALHTPMNMLLHPPPTQDLNLTPDELLFHPPLTCVDENGVYLPVSLADCYQLLVSQNRHIYRTICESQGFDFAKRKLLEIFRLREVVAPAMTGGGDNGMGLMVSGLLGDEDGLGRVGCGYDAGQQQQHGSSISLQEYDPQLFDVGAGSSFEQSMEQTVVHGLAFDDWSDGLTLGGDDVFDPLLAGDAGEPAGECNTADTAAQFDVKVEGDIDFALDTEELGSNDWGQDDKLDFYSLD